MAHSYTNLLYHIVFATKGRQNWLDKAIRPDLFAYLGQVIGDEGGISLLVNGTSDHVHLLVKLQPDRSVSGVLSNLKSRSSGWIHRERPDLAHFAWQTGYGAFSVGQSQVPRVRRYIQNQETHHKKIPYVEEFRSLLRKSGFAAADEFFWE